MTELQYKSAFGPLPIYYTGLIEYADVSSYKDTNPTGSGCDLI